LAALCGAAGVAVDGALFVAGGAVLFLLGDGGEIGDVVFGGHGYGAEEETGEGGVLVEDGAALGVDVEDVEGVAASGELGFDAAEKELEDGGFEGVEEEGEGGGAGQVEGEGVLLVELDGGEGLGGGVSCVGFAPEVDIALGYVGHLRIELDADDFVEGEFAGDEHGSAFAGADVEEGVAVDGVGWDGLAPVADEGAEDAGGDAVVGGDEGVVGVAGEKVAGGDEAAGVQIVGEVEGVNGSGGELEEILRALAGRRLGVRLVARLGDEEWLGHGRVSGSG
jgi:hypothetical protein